MIDQSKNKILSFRSISKKLQYFHRLGRKED